MFPRKYVSLLPASGSRNDADQSSSSGNAQEDTNKRKRIGTQVACNSCRLKKTRCDGQRPTCGPCRKRTTECTYTVRKDLGEEQHEILELLKWLPEHRAFDVLRVLRANHGDCAAALSVIKSGPGGAHRPSDLHVLRDEVPAQPPLEIELMARHPIAYPMLHPISITALQESNLLCSVNSTRPSESSFQRRFKIRDPPTTGELFNIDADSAVKLYRSYGALEESLPMPRDYCDVRLSALNISAWTTVQVSNELAARIISLYLKTDHPLLGTFDPDLFVSDLITQQRRFCSSLLVNALLYWGCQMYSAIDKGVDKYTQLFCAEAESLWSEAKQADTLLNMAGAQLLSLAFMGHGKDYTCLRYLTEAVNMGWRLKLFGRLDAIGKETQRDMSIEDQSATSFAAWGVFNWSVLTATFYRQPDTVYPEYPPVLPIPGNDGTDQDTPADDGSSSEEASISAKRSLPAYMGKTFTFLCQLWRIVHGVTLRYCNEGKRVLEPPRLDFAEMKYRELLAWMQNLPAEMARGEDNPHHVVVFHIWLHAAVLDLFRPFVKEPGMKQTQLKTFSARQCSPADAFNASVEQLKHLIIDYRTGYESSACTILWHTALMYVANAVLVSRDSDWRIYFLLCIYGYESLNRPFRVSEAIGTSLLTMTLRNHDITADEARSLLLELKERGLHLQSEGTIRATFMGDLELAMSDPEGAKVENLANSFEDMVLFREFVNDALIEDEPMLG